MSHRDLKVVFFRVSDLDLGRESATCRASCGTDVALTGPVSKFLMVVSICVIVSIQAHLAD